MQITINFTVTGQIIAAACQDHVLVAGSRDVVYAQFALDDAWSGLTVVALFSNDFYNNGQPIERLMDGDLVKIPPEVLVNGKLQVGLNGFGADGALLLPTKRMDRGLLVRQNGGIIAMAAEDATPTLLAQIIAAAGEAQDAAANASEAAADASSAAATANESATLADQAMQSLIDAANNGAFDGQSATLEITGADSLPYGESPAVIEQKDSTPLARVYRLAIPEGAQGPPGNVMYATFDIDPATGELTMTTPDGYNGPSFAINSSGELEVNIHA